MRRALSECARRHRRREDAEPVAGLCGGKRDAPPDTAGDSEEGVPRHEECSGELKRGDTAGAICTGSL